MGHVTITDVVSNPAFTATKTTAYEAHGVNGTILTHEGTSVGTSTYTAAEYLITANATAHGIPDNELTACQINGTLANNGPFCSPLHEQNLWVGYTYASRLQFSSLWLYVLKLPTVTWNPALFSKNTSDYVVLKYDGNQQGIVWNSTQGSKQEGYANINMDKSWLMGAPGNDSSSGQNLTFYLYSGPGNVSTGPMISLVTDPHDLPPLQFHKLPKKYGIEIGIPVGLVAALIIILAIWCGMRKHQRNWKDIRSSGHDYMQKRQRRRGRVGKDGGIQLEEMRHPRDQDAFSDEPYTGGSGNAFRDEVARQREEDDRYRTNITSF